MAVHDVGLDVAEPPAKSRQGGKIGRAGMAADARGVDAEPKAAGNRRERFVDARTQALAVEEHADVVAAGRLLAREIDDMTEQPA